MKLKKRFILLIIATAAAVLFSVLFIMSVGSRYSVFTSDYELISHSIEYTPDDLEKAVSNVSITFDKGQENVVKLTDTGFDRSSKLIHFDFEAVSKGKAFIDISFVLNGKKVTEYLSLSVHSFNIITNDNMFDFSGSLVIEIIIVILLLLFTAVTGYSFFEKIRLAEYSYDMILYGGVSLFCLHQLIYASVTFFRNINAYHNMSYFALFCSDLNSSVSMFCLSSIPVLFIMAIFVSISNVSLIMHEGFRPLNMLGIIFGLMWAASTVLMYVFNGMQFTHTYEEERILTIIRTPVWFIMLYLECMLLSTIVCAFSASRYTPKYNKDYIIILGCAIRKDGSLTPLLKGRADKAIQFEKAQYEKTGKHAKFVPSGGQGSDEIISEAEAIKRYLIQQNIPEEQILKEDKSVNTLQNMQFSKKIIADDFHGENPEIAFSTTNYHVFRSYMLANKNQMKAKGMGCRTKFYFFPNAFLREFIGLLVEEKLLHITAVVIISALYSCLGVLSWI